MKLKPHRRTLLPILVIYQYFTYFARAEHVPIQYKINSKQAECVYDQFVKNDVVTVSVFVIEALNNGKPKASISFEGPIAGNKGLIPLQFDQHGNHNVETKNLNENGDGLERAGQRGKMTTGRSIRSSLLSDWPKIKGPNSPEGVIERNIKVDWTHAGESEDAVAARAAIMEKTHEEFRMHRMEHKGKEDGDKSVPPLPVHTYAKNTIDPYEETLEIEAQGWYRLCVKSDFMPLVVEMDIRSADKLKGINPGTGHVYTHALREHLDEQMLLSESEEGEEIIYHTIDGQLQVKSKDFDESKIKLKYLHDLTSEIMKNQHQRMHSSKAHDADAKRGAAELVWSSRFETLLYVIISGVQVYTVHKWLLGNLPLGK